MEPTSLDSLFSNKNPIKKNNGKTTSIEDVVTPKSNIPVLQSDSNIYSTDTSIDIRKHAGDLFYGTQDTKEIQAKSQPTIDRIGNALGNFGVASAGFLTTTVGQLAGVLPAIATQDASKIWDNPIAKAGENMNKWAEEAMPLYSTHAAQDATWLENLYGKGRAQWWLKEGMGRAALVAGMFIPGAAIGEGFGLSRAIGAGLEEAGLGESLGYGEKGISDAFEFTKNYTSTAAGKTIPGLSMNSPAVKFVNGLKGAEQVLGGALPQMAITAKPAEDAVREYYTNGEGKNLGLSKEEIDKKAFDAADRAFWQAGVTALPTAFIMAKQMYGSFGGAKNLLEKAVDKYGNPIKVAEETLGQKVLISSLKSIGTGIESGVNETSQVAIGRAAELWGEGKIKNDDLADIYKTYMDGWKDDPNMQNNMLLGTVQGILESALGPHGSIAKYRRIASGKEKSEASQILNLQSLINSAALNYHDQLNNFADTDKTTGKIKTDKDGNVLWDKEKVAKSIIAQIGAKRCSEDSMIGALSDNELMKHWSDHNAMSGFAYTFFNKKGGVEYLNNFIDAQKKAELEDANRINDRDVNGNEITPHQKAEELKILVKELSKVYDRTQKQQINTDEIKNIPVEDRDAVIRNVDLARKSLYDTASQQVFLNNHKKRNASEIHDLSTSLSSNANKNRIEFLTKENENLDKVSEELDKDYESLTNGKKLKEAIEKQLSDEKIKQEELRIKAEKAAAEEAKKKDQSNIYKDDTDEMLSERLEKLKDATDSEGKSHLAAVKSEINRRAKVKGSTKKTNKTSTTNTEKIEIAPINQVVDENPALINSNHIDDDSKRKKDDINSTNAGIDNGENHFYRAMESLSHEQLNGAHLKVVTKKTDSKLYNEILNDDASAKEYEKNNPEHKGIWTVLVDSKGNEILHNGKRITSTLETASRVLHEEHGIEGAGAVDVARDTTDPDEAIKVREAAIENINTLRSNIHSLKEGDVRHLRVDGKSKGLVSSEEGHSAFEEKDPITKERQSNSIVGRIFNSIKNWKDVKLTIGTFSEVWHGSPIEKGKLYILGENGRVFDLIPRRLNNQEIDLVSELIVKAMDGRDVSQGFDAVKEIKKIMSFKGNPNDTRWQIFIKNGELVFGEKKVSLNDLNTNFNIIVELQDFLADKRVNANNELLGSTDFTEPDINGRGKKIIYQEYLLGGKDPMFGTDLKKSEINGKPTVRFIQTYLTYDNELVKLDSNKELTVNEIKTESNVLNNPQSEVIRGDSKIIENTEEIKSDIDEEFPDRKLDELDRLASIAKNKSKLTKEEKEWFAKNHPRIPIDVVEGLIAGKSLGRFISSGKVLLSSEATTGTLYHEAFHAVTQLYLNKKEIDKLYKEASEKYPNKTRKQLEEVLAEDFANYKESGKVLNEHPARNTFFRRILNVLRDFLGFNVKDVQHLYKRIDSGYYANKGYVGTREFSSLNRSEGAKRLTEEKGTKFIKDVLDSFDVMFFNHIYDKGRSPIAVVNNMSKLADWVFMDIKQLAKTEKNQELVNEYKYILRNFNDIYKTWADRLNSNGVKLSIKTTEKEISEENHLDKKDGDSSKGDQYAEGNLTSTLESMDSQVRMLLMSLKKVDKNGVDIKNSLGMPSTVDFKSTYNYLLKNTVGLGSDYSDLYNKIVELGSVKPEFKQLAKLIGPSSDIITDEKMVFQNQFLQAFNKNRTNSIITTYDSIGNIRIVDANRQNEADRVKTEWENSLTKFAKQNAEGRLIVDTSIIDTKNPIEFLAKIGITFDSETVNIINSKTFDDTELNASVKGVKEYIKYHNGDVTDIYNQIKDFKSDSDQVKLDKFEQKKVSIVGGRLNYLLNLEAQHTSLVNELSFISADGKTEYSVSENNGLSITTNAINNAKSLSELYEKFPHLNTIGCEGSLWLNQLFDKETGARISDAKITLELHNGITTTDDVENKTKQPTRDGTKGDLFTQFISGILNGKSSFIVSSDKSQEWVISLSQYDGKNKLPISIDDFKNGFVSIKLQDIFKDYFRSEVSRVVSYELDGIGKNVANYNKNGGKLTIFHEIAKSELKGKIDAKINELKSNNISWVDFKDDQTDSGLDKFIESTSDLLNKDVQDFFVKYVNSLRNSLVKNEIVEKEGLPKDFTDKYSVDQILRATVVTDFINSIEQTKLFIGDLAFYKDLYKRTSMFAGTKQMPRVDSKFDSWMNTMHPRTDGKKCDGFENTIVYADVETEKQDVNEWADAFVKEGFTKRQAMETLGWSYDEKSGKYNKDSGHSAAKEGDAQGWGSMDFIMEFNRRLGTSTPAMENAYKLMSEQKFDENGKLVEGRLLTKEEIVSFPALKLQYAGPIDSNKNGVLFIPGGYKFTVLPLIPQMTAGRNLSKVSENMKNTQSGIALFNSASKFGTVLHNDNKANRFYTNGNTGDVNSKNILTQSISYQYLGLQVKPSEAHNDATFSTQFRKTPFIDAFENGKESIPGAKDIFDEYTSLMNERAKRDKDKLIKSLGINPISNSIEDATNLVKLLVSSGEDRKLADNIIDSLDVEEVDGKKQLKYSISSMVNKAKIDSMLTSLINNRLIRQKFNGDAYVLAAISGMEKIGIRNTGTNTALRGYTRDTKTGKTIPAQVMIPMHKNYYSLLNKFGSLEAVNQAIKNGEIDNKVLELAACRIPGQGMNSNEYLTIAEFLPEDCSTTMVAHPDIVAKAGSDFDNDKLYTYRPNLDENGVYLENNIDNKIINQIVKLISHEKNFTSLVTPNSTSIIDESANKIKYVQYENRKKSEGANPMPFDEYIKSLSKASSNIMYTDSLTLHKKVEARHKLWLAKNEVGPAAIANAYGPLSQITGLTANSEYFTGKLDKFGAKIKEIVEFGLPVNMINGKLNLGAKYDALGKNKISDINNQIINIAVDAAKDETPTVSYLNITMDTLPSCLFLNKIGVPFDYVANFMAQPIISEYLQANGANESGFLKAAGKSVPRYEIFNNIEKKYTKDGVVSIKGSKISLEMLTESLKAENQSTPEFKSLQLRVLNEFKNYQKYSKVYDDHVRITNSDSSGLGKNINASRVKMNDTVKTLETGFINGIDRVRNETFLKAFNQDDFAVKTYSPLYDTQREDLINTIIRIGEEYAKTQSNDERIKSITNVENDFINYIVQNYGYKNVVNRKESLFKGENSIAKRLLDLKTKKTSECTPDELKLKNNILIQQLFPLIDKAKPGSSWDNIKIYNKKLDVFTQNQLTEAFREIKDIKPDMFNDLVDLSILQSGLNNSPITFLGLTPFEYYNDLVKRSFSEFNKKNGAEDLYKFERLYTQNERRAIGYGMYGKDFNEKLIKVDKNTFPKELSESLASNVVSEDSNNSIAFDEAKPLSMKQNELDNKLQTEEKKSIFKEEKTNSGILISELYDELTWNSFDEKKKDKIKKCQ